MKDIRKRVGYMPGKFHFIYQDLYRRRESEILQDTLWFTIEQGYDYIRYLFTDRTVPRTVRQVPFSVVWNRNWLSVAPSFISRGVLFLDEPTTGVDPVSRKEFWEMLQMLLERDIGIVAATPYLDEVRQCRRVAFDHGEVRGMIRLKSFSVFQGCIQSSGDRKINAMEVKDENVGGGASRKSLWRSMPWMISVSLSDEGEIFGFLGS